MGKFITMERVRSLYDYAMCVSNLEQLNELNDGIINQDCVMLIIILILFGVGLILSGLYLKMVVDMSAKR